MTQPREIVPGRTYMITRRCAQREFLLRPDEKTTQTFLYCLANASRNTGVEVLFSTVMSNHHHTIVYDPHGRVSEFCHDLHSLTARAMNCLRGREENFWSRKSANILRLADRPAVIAKMAYAATNPVRAHLVEHGEHWPGLNTADVFFRGRTLRVDRPEHFFGEDSDLPETLSLTLGWPPHLGAVEDAREALRVLIDKIEGQMQQERVSRRICVLGRNAVRRQDFHARPSSEPPRRSLSPTIAAGDPATRVAAVLGYRAFLDAYRRARALWLAGLPALFPPGTYWLRRVPGVVVASLTTSQ